MWSTNQPGNLNHIGWSFLTIPYWEGWDQWSSPELNLLILSWKLKAKNGTVQDLLHHVLTIPSTQISQQWIYQLCQWEIRFHQLWQARLHCLYREIFLSVPPVWVNLPPEVITNMPRWSTRSIKGIPPVRFTPSKKWAMCVVHNGTLWKPVEKLFLCSVRTYQGSHFSALTKFQDFIQNSRYNFLSFFLMWPPYTIG